MTSITDARAALTILDSLAAQVPDLQDLVKPVDAWFAAQTETPAAPPSIFSATSPAEFKAYGSLVLQEKWTKIDPKIWSNRLWYGDGINDYTVNSVDPALASVSNGRLQLVARAAPNASDKAHPPAWYGGRPYMGSIAHTYDLFSLTVPFAVEVSIQNSPKPYEWSSFVIQELDGWEIDINEVNTNNGRFIATAAHNKAKNIHRTYGYDPTQKVDPNFRLSDDHIVHCIIDAETVTVWVDGKLVSSFPNPGITGPMFMYFANGVGGWNDPVHTMKPFPYPGSGTMSVGPITIGKPA